MPNGDKLRASSLEVSTYDSSIIVTDIDLASANAKNDIKIKAIELHGVRPREILLKDKIRIKRIDVLSPDLKVFSESSQNNGFNLDLKSYLNGKVKSYEVGKLYITDGKMNLNNGKVRVQHINIILNQFALNEQSIKRSNFLLSTRSRIRLNKIQVEIPKSQHNVQMAALLLDSKNGKVGISNWGIRPNVEDSSTVQFLANANGNTIEVEGIDFDHITELSDIDLNKVFVNHIEAKINLLGKADTVSTPKDSSLAMFFKSLSDVQLANVNVENIDVLLQKNGSSLVKFSDAFFLSNQLNSDSTLLANGKLILTGDSNSFGMSKIMLPLRKNNHMLSIQSFHKANDSNLVANGISLRPIPGAIIPDSSSKIIAYFPKLTASDFQMIGRKDVDTLTLGFIDIYKPRIKIQLPNAPKSRKKRFYLPEQLPQDFVDEVFEMFRVKGFSIHQGKLEVKKSDYYVTVNKMDLKSEGWQISKSSSWDPKRFMYAADFELSLKELEYQLPNTKFCHHIDSINYSFKPNCLSFHGFYFNNREHTTEKENTQVSFYLPHLKLVNPDIYSYLTDSSLIISKIESGRGYLEADLYANKEGEAKPIQIPVSIPKFKGINKIAIHEIEIEKMDLEMRRHEKNKIAPLEMDHFSLVIDSFHVFPGEKLDSNRVLWSNSIDMSVQNVYTTVDGGLYEIGADQFSFSTQKDSIGASRLTFLPTVPRMEYALHKGGYQKDVFNLDLKELRFTDFNFNKLLYEGKVEGGELRLTKPNLSVFKDKRNDLPPKQHKDILPQKFKEVPLKITMDSVMVDEMRIRYDEFPAQGRDPGYVTLTHTNIKATNFTNDTAYLEKDSTLTITMNSMFLNSGKVDLRLKYNMLSPNNYFEMNTSLGSMDATLINSYIEPAYSAKILSANIDRMNMRVVGNDSLAGGNMELFYDNLKFQFMDQESQHSKKFLSFIGNTVVKSKNKYHYFKKGKDLFVLRDTSKGWINYLVKIELAGAQANAGINKEKGQKIKRDNKEAWKAFKKRYDADKRREGKIQKQLDKAKRKQTRQNR